jgi:hypothetical protein
MTVAVPIYATEQPLSAQGPSSLSRLAGHRAGGRRWKRVLSRAFWLSAQAFAASDPLVAGYYRMSEAGYTLNDS